MFSGYLSAQIYSGKVTDECSGKALSGIQIGLTSNIGGTSTFTDANGNWQKNVSQHGGASYWIIYLIEPGISLPGSHFVIDNNQNKGNLNFSHLIDEWGFAFDINGENLPFYNSPPYYTNPSSPLNLCSNEDICLSLSSEYTDAINGTTDCYTFRVSIFTTDLNGNPITFIGDDCFDVDGRLAIGVEPCGAYSFDINAIMSSSEFKPNPNTPLYVKIEQFCCTRECASPKKGLVNSEHFYMAINSILDADVEFQFLTNLQIDGENGNDPIDGLEPTSQFLPGPSLPDATLGIDASIVQNSGSPLTQVTYVIEEVDCMNPLDAEVIFENTVNLDNTGQPENYTFANDFRFTDTGFPPPFDDIPWFTWDANTEDKCFLATVTVSNECGEASASSFFTISESCQFCMPTNPNGGIDERNAESSNTEASLIPNELASVSVFPNPATSNIYFKVDSQEVTTIKLFNISGREVDSFTTSSNIEYDLSAFPQGTYFYSWISGEKRGEGKIIKL